LQDVINPIQTGELNISFSRMYANLFHFVHLLCVVLVTTYIL
jgi:hypothetical protein